MLLEARGSSIQDIRKPKKEEMESETHLLRNDSQGNISDRKSSRSRSRDKEPITHRKEVWAGKLWGFFSSPDWTKESLTVLLTDTLRCAKN